MLINGLPQAHVSVRDRGLAYGDGIFTAIRISKGRPILWAYHQARLKQGCFQLGIPYDRDLIELEFEQLLNGRGDDEGVAKIIITRGISDRGYRPSQIVSPTRIMTLDPRSNAFERIDQSGIQIVLCQYRLPTGSSLAGIKHLNRLDQVMASREIIPPFQEGLMLDHSGWVIEGTKSNIFVGTVNGLVTPDLSLAGVAGVMREYLLDAFANDGLAVAVNHVPLNLLAEANEVFLCNSVHGIWPVIRLETDQGSLNWDIGAKTRLAQSFQRMAFEHELA